MLFLFPVKVGKLSTGVNATFNASYVTVKAHSHQARLRPSTDVNALKIEPCSILSASTDVDVRRRMSTSVDVRLRPTTPIQWQATLWHVTRS